MNAPHDVMKDRPDGNHLADRIDILVLKAEFPDEGDFCRRSSFLPDAGDRG